MLKQFTDWLWSLIVAAFGAVWGLLQDAFIAFFTLVVNGFASLVAAIPVPAFISGGLGSLWAQMDPGMVYLLSEAGVPAAFAVLGGGYAFRLARKFLTLFQW
ncbi:hypothetical protein CY658_02905 [Variovorax sp. RO1]|uniref:hypothetical protein n=1 Tax=unclassified Variovorax TaxID=663243 RepID=UPI000C717AEC|nr:MULTISPECIES: hypothetical protein [Variovorax]PLC06016.1 hypothetical protein CY658_02905 [Variovorax sp. RO1]WPG40575.1 hypothetical protein RZE79_14885 [Variovorax boronicumulans]